MFDNQERLRHGILTQHAPVGREKVRFSRDALVETLFDSEGSYFLGSCVFYYIDATVPDGFLGGPSCLSLPPLYPYHDTRHM